MSFYPEHPFGEAVQLTLRPVEVEPTEKYPITGVLSFGRGLFRRPTIAGSETKYSKLFKIHENDLVLSRLKAFEGAIAVASKEVDGTYASQEFPTFSVNKNVCVPEYIRALCMWPELWSRLSSGSQGVGSRRERVSAQRLLETPIPLPDLAEQRRIAYVLDRSIGEYGAARESRDELEKALRTALLRWAFEGDHPQRPFGDFLGDQPSASLIDPLRTYTTAGIYSYGRGIFRRPAVAGIETKYSRYTQIQAGQFVYSRLFAWEGALAVVEPDQDGLFVSPEFPVFNLREDLIDRRYVRYLCSWPGLYERLRGKTSGMGNRRQRVQVEQLRSTPVPLPDVAQQRAICDRLDVAFARAEPLLDHRRRLDEALKPSLLNAAFSGQL